ncbi:CHAT domain-containing protein [Saccharopolyspora taberi]|uniref:CHAT domain-containing protein n=1 Tax=Saccharopolyspora taberi TaxID=60895 RepID=A0ABN3VM56_9PSEU
MSAGTAVLPAGDTRIESALWWREHAGEVPETALREAEKWLAEPGCGPELRVLSKHVAALAAVERGRLREARRYAVQGLAVARRAGLDERVAQLRLTLAWIEFDRGKADASWQQLTGAEPGLRGPDLARAACLRGLLHCQGDRFYAAVTQLTEALPVLREGGDQRWVANALAGRGLARMYSNSLDAAESDLAEAERIFADGAQPGRAAGCRHNRGCVAFRAGELPRALRLFADALAMGLDTDSNPEALVDRAEALAAAGLNGEARVEMERAAGRLAGRGREVRLAETRLALAGCALRDGDAEAAAEAASEARRLFRAHRRPAWAALAAATEWQAKLAGGHRSRSALASARRAGVVCAGYGWAAPAAELWLTAGRAAREAGMRAMSRKLLALAAAAREAPRAGAGQLAAGWLAQALLAEQDGDLTRLFEACAGGLKAIESHAAAIAAFELRVHTFGLAADLADTAVSAAMRVADPLLVLRWTERSRASALRRRALNPPSDPELRESLVELRSAVCGRADQPAAMDGIEELESRVRRRAMLVSGRTDSSWARWGFADAVAELGDSVLLSFFASRGRLHAVSIVDGKFELHSLAAESLVGGEVGRLRNFLSRQAERPSLRVRAAFEDWVRSSAEILEREVLGPVLPALAEERPLVVVPTGSLHALPWSALPACRGRSVTVAPSLRCWLRGVADLREGAGRDRQVWVSGPGLPDAEREVRALHEVAGGALLTGRSATAEDVLSTVDGAAVAHIAAHGRFRSDQPLLSCLELADGPLYGYDLDRLQRGPATVVLSACEVGQSAISGCDQLSGLAAALLGRGTATVIASVIPVPDDRTAAVMVTLHAALRRGLPPAQALAEAQAEHGETGFVCLGYGGR